jgi:hypothetical protein
MTSSRRVKDMNLEKPPMNDKTRTYPGQADAMDFRDLMDDLQSKGISEYLTISVSNDGHNTMVSVSTIEDQPETYSAVLYGVTATSLQMLLGDSFDTLLTNGL